MISIKKQKKILFIPFVNFAILFITVFINSKYMIKNWRLQVFKYMAIGMIFSFPLLLLKDVVNRYTDSIMVDFAIYYVLSVIVYSFLLYCQQKYGISK